MLVTTLKEMTRFKKSTGGLYHLYSSMENENVLVVSKKIGRQLPKSSKHGFTEAFIKTEKEISRNTFHIVET